MVEKQPDAPVTAGAAESPERPEPRDDVARLGPDGAGNLDLDGVARLYKDRHLGGLTRVSALLGANVDVVAAEGPWLTLADGRRLFDAHASNGAVAFGHNHPALVAAARRALDARAVGFPGLLPSRGVAALCNDLVAIAPPGVTRAVLYNTGAEAVEGALVIASLAQGKRDLFVGFEGGFHGKSAAARAVGGIPFEREGFPPWAATETLPYGDLGAAEAFFRRDGRRIAAVVVEPIQSNAGVRVPPEGFLPGLRELCSRAGALLVVDEVSTGFGRTGARFACMHEGVAPDLLCLAKALSGGLVPVAAVLVADGLAKVMGNPRFASHFSTTFAGGHLATGIALEAVRLLVEEDVPERARALGARLGEGLEALRNRHPRLLRDVRGRGLLFALELGDPADLPAKFLPRGVGDFLASRFGGSVAIAFQRYLAQHHGLLLTPTAADRRVVRIFPPLVSGPEEIDHVVGAIDAGLRDGLPAWVRNLT